MNTEKYPTHLFKEQGVVYLDVIKKCDEKNIDVIGFSKDRLDLVQEEINITIQEIEKGGHIVFEWGEIKGASRKFCYYFKYGKLV